MNASLPLFHPAELSCVHRLLEVADAFAAVSAYAEEEDGDSDGRRPGLYAAALRDGLCRVLSPYRRAVEALEAEVLASPCGRVALARIQHEMEPFAPVLMALNRLIKQVTERG